MMLPQLTIFTATLAMDSKLSQTELFYTTPGIQNVSWLLCTDSELCLLLCTAADFGHDEHGLK